MSPVDLDFLRYFFLLLVLKGKILEMYMKGISYRLQEEIRATIVPCLASLRTSNMTGLDE